LACILVKKKLCLDENKERYLLVKTV